MFHKYTDIAQEMHQVVVWFGVELISKNEKHSGIRPLYPCTNIFFTSFFGGGRVKMKDWNDLEIHPSDARWCLSWEQTHFWMLRERKLGAPAISFQNQNIKNLNQKMLTSIQNQNIKNKT